MSPSEVLTVSLMQLSLGRFHMLGDPTIYSIILPLSCAERLQLQQLEVGVIILAEHFIKFAPRCSIFLVANVSRAFHCSIRSSKRQLRAIKVSYKHLEVVKSMVCRQIFKQIDPESHKMTRTPVTPQKQLLLPPLEIDKIERDRSNHQISHAKIHIAIGNQPKLRHKSKEAEPTQITTESQEATYHCKHDALTADFSWP